MVSEEIMHRKIIFIYKPLFKFTESLKRIFINKSCFQETKVITCG